LTILSLSDDCSVRPAAVSRSCLMPLRRCPCAPACARISVGLVLLTAASSCPASAFVRGAWYRLGAAHPRATAGAVGNDPTVDSFADSLNLARTGSPHYAADTPPL